MIKEYLISLKSSVYKDDFNKFLKNNNIQYELLDSIYMYILNTTENYIIKIKALHYIDIALENREFKLVHDTQISQLNKSDTLKTKTNDILNWGLTRIKAPCLWSKGITGKGVRVAVLDTGIDADTILTVKGNISFTNTGPMDRDGHGTEVAGVIAGKAEPGNPSSVIGVAYDCDLYNVKISNYGTASAKVLAEGINWCVGNRMNIINMSLGVQPSELTPDETRIITDATKRAVQAGIIVVVASGNESLDVIDVPSNVPGVISVGSIDINNQRSSFSNYGLGLTFVAPGEDIKTISLDEEYVVVSGTSFSTPHVAGLAALLLSQNRNLSAQQIKDILINNALNLGSPGYNIYYGYGLVQAPQFQLVRSIVPSQRAYNFNESGKIDFIALSEDLKPVENVVVNAQLKTPTSEVITKELITDSKGVATLDLIIGSESNGEVRINENSQEIVINDVGPYTVKAEFNKPCCSCGGSENNGFIVKYNDLYIKVISKEENCSNIKINILVTDKEDKPIQEANIDVIIKSCSRVIAKCTSKTNEAGLANLSLNYCYNYNNCCKQIIITASKENYNSKTISTN